MLQRLRVGGLGDGLGQVHPQQPGRDRQIGADPAADPHRRSPAPPGTPGRRRPAPTRRVPPGHPAAPSARPARPAGCAARSAPGPRGAARWPPRPGRRPARPPARRAARAGPPGHATPTGATPRRPARGRAGRTGWSSVSSSSTRVPAGVGVSVTTCRSCTGGPASSVAVSVCAETVPTTIRSGTRTPSGSRTRSATSSPGASSGRAAAIRCPSRPNAAALSPMSRSSPAALRGAASISAVDRSTGTGRCCQAGSTGCPPRPGSCAPSARAGARPRRLLLPLVACGLLGLINGVLVGRARMAPFIVTLAALLFARGLAFAVVRRGQQGLHHSRRPRPDPARPGEGARPGARSWLRSSAFARRAGGAQPDPVRAGGRSRSAAARRRPSSWACRSPGSRSLCLRAAAPLLAGARRRARRRADLVGPADDRRGPGARGDRRGRHRGTLLTGGAGSLGGTLAGVLLLKVIQNLINQVGTLSAYVPAGGQRRLPRRRGPRAGLPRAGVGDCSASTRESSTEVSGYGSRWSAPATGGASITRGFAGRPDVGPVRDRRPRPGPHRRSGPSSSAPGPMWTSRDARPRTARPRVGVPAERGALRADAAAHPGRVPAVRREAAGVRPRRGRRRSSTEAEQRGLFFAINFNHRYAKPVQLAAEAIARGELGRLVVRHLALRRRSGHERPPVRQPHRDPVPRPRHARAPLRTHRVGHGPDDRRAGTGCRPWRSRCSSTAARWAASSARTTPPTPIRPPTASRSTAPTVGCSSRTPCAATPSSRRATRRPGLAGRLLQRHRARVPCALRPPRRRDARRASGRQSRPSTPRPATARSCLLTASSGRTKRSPRRDY